MIRIYLINGTAEVDITERCSSATLDEAVNSFAKLTFTLVAEADVWDELLPLLSHVRAVDGNTLLYYGRILTVTPKMDNQGIITKTVICEDRMAYLCDSVQPYREPMQYDTLTDFISLVLNNHNSQVEDYKQILPGNITLSTYETSEGVYKGLNYETTWDTLKEKLLDVFGGEMALRESGGTLYLDYAENLGSTVSTTIALAKNMRAGEHTLDPTQIVTRLIPLGAKLVEETLDEWGNPAQQETEERLTIESVNDGVIWLENQSAVALYGVHYGTIIWDDVTTAAALRSKGIQYLANENTPVDSFTIDAVDLATIGVDASRIAMYNFYPVQNELIGVNTTLEVIRKTTDLFQPHLPTVTFGSRKVWLSDLVNNESDRLNAVEAQTGSNSTQIYNLANSTQVYVDNSVSGLEEFATAEVEKYIRMENGQIVIGIVDDPVSLTLGNDRISFMQNGVEVAYLSNNKLFVTDGEFLTSVRIGNFQFIPRDNGNLSFMKVGGT